MIYKFRGKRLDNGEWVYGFYVVCRCHHYILEYCEFEIGFDDRYQDWIEIEPKTVGEFTGLTDKNGKEIYEGQYLYVPYNHIGFQRCELKNGCFNVAGFDLNSCTIYDTPELLEVEK